MIPFIGRLRAGTASPTPTIGSSGSPEPLMSPSPESVHAPMTPGEEFKRSSKVLQPEVRRYKEHTSNIEDLLSGLPATPKPSSPTNVQDKVQDGEESEFYEDEEHVETTSRSPFTTHYSSESESETVHPGFKRTKHRVTSVTTTTTKVQGQKRTNVQSEESTSVGETNAQPEKDVPTESSQSPFSETHSTLFGWSQPGASVFRATSPSGVSNAGRSPIMSSVSSPIDPRFVPLPKPDLNSLDKLFQIQRLHREEKQRILDLAAAEYEDYKRYCEEQLEVFQTENGRLLQELSASASRIALLEFQLESRGDNRRSGAASQHEEIDSTITTTITTITTAITTVSNRIEQWKRKGARNRTQITISNTELEQLLSDLSTASSQMTELQQSYAGLWNDFSSVLLELQSVTSERDENDRTIATLTTEVEEWRNADTAKAEQLTAIRRDNETLRLDLSAASSRTAELQQRYDAQSREFRSARKELQTKVTLIEEKDRTIATFTAEVAQWKRSDVTRANQISTMRKDYEKLQGDFSSSSSQIATLQKRYDSQSKELSSARSELQTNKSLVGERDRTITTLAAEVDQWKRTDATKAKQLATEHRAREKVQGDLATSFTRMADLQKRYDGQSRDNVTIRKELQTKTSLLEERKQTITSLTTELTQVKRENSAKEEQITNARRDIEQLQRELSSSSDKFTKLQEHYTAQSHELSSARDKLHQIEISGIAALDKHMEDLRQDLATATSRNSELQRSCDELSSEVNAAHEQLSVQVSQHEGAIASLTAQIHQWKRSDAMKAEEIATTLNQVEMLQQELSTSTEELVELHARYDAQSRDFIAMRNEIQVISSSSEDKDRTIVTLTAEIDQWKNGNEHKAEQVATSLKCVEELQQALTASASEIAELQGRYAAQSSELASLRSEFQINVSSYEGKDHTIASLNAEISQWKRTDAAKAEQIASIVKQFERFRRDLSASTSDTELQRRYVAQSQELISVRNELQASISSNDEKDRTIAVLTTEIEDWKSTDTWREENIEVTRKRIEDLQRHYTAQVAELSSQIEQWKRSDAAKADELTMSHKKLEQLRRELSTTSSRISDIRQRYEAKLAENSSLREQLRATWSFGGGKDRTDAGRNTHTEQWPRTDGNKPHRNPSASSMDFDVHKASTSMSEETKKLHETITTKGIKDYAAVIKLTAMVDQWLHSDAKRAEELTRELEKRNKENEELRENLVTLKEIYIQAPELKHIFQSETIEIQCRYEEQSRELKSTLADRQSQLDGVQRFVNTPDVYADTMIIQMLQRLNAEILQNTMFVAECVLKDFRPRTAQPTKDQSSAARRVAESIGQTLKGCLESGKRDDVALYLPIAFQAFLAYYLHSTISSWTIKKERNQFINEIYERLQKSEAQMISGRWRSLTHTYISPTCVSNPDTMVEVTIAGLSDILVVAGCADSVLTAKSNMMSQFKDKVLSIVTIARQFSKMIWEEVSADFEVVAVPSLHMFEETTMEDADDYDKAQGPNEEATGQKVLCSTQLGMTKRMQLQSGDRDTLTVIKAKVILESFLYG